MIRFSAEIAEAQPERPDYLHSVLCQVGLPRSRTQGTKFKRTNGNASLLVEAGSLWNGTDWIEQPLPYGTRPRLALVYVSSEAVRTKSPTVGFCQRSRQAWCLLASVGLIGSGWWLEWTGGRDELRLLWVCGRH